MLNNSPSFQSQLILSQIPLADILEGFRAIVREEIKAEQSSVREVSKEIITPEVLRQRLNISQPTEIKWRKKGKLPSLNIGTAIRYEWGAVLSALSKTK